MSKKIFGMLFAVFIVGILAVSAVSAYGVGKHGCATAPAGTDYSGKYIAKTPHGRVSFLGNAGIPSEWTMKCGFGKGGVFKTTQ